MGMERHESTSHQTSSSATGAGSTDTAKQKTQEVTDKLGQTADTVQQQANQVASQQFTAQTQQATKGLDSVSGALNQAADQMRKQGQDTMATFADEAASQVDRLSGYLRQEDLHQVIDGVERFARRQPYLFLGGAFAVGVLAARFLKASRPEQAAWGRSGSYQSQYQYQSPFGQQYGPQNYPGSHYGGRQPFASGFETSAGYGYPYSGQSGTGGQFRTGMGSSYGSGYDYGTATGAGAGTSGYGATGGAGSSYGSTAETGGLEVEALLIEVPEDDTGVNLGSAGDAMGRYPDTTSTEGSAYRREPGETNRSGRDATE